MLRTIARIAVPGVVQACKIFDRCITRDFASWKIVNTYPKRVPFLNLQENRKMCTTITDDMILYYEEFVNLKDAGDIIIIDVRNPNELEESGKIEGSINIPLPDLQDAFESLSPEEFENKYGIPKPALDAPLVFHCRSGMRSIQALYYALNQGYENAKHYQGGFSDWEERSGWKQN